MYVCVCACVRIYAHARTRAHTNTHTNTPTITHTHAQAIQIFDGLKNTDNPELQTNCNEALQELTTLALSTHDQSNTSNAEFVKMLVCVCVCGWVGGYMFVCV